MKPVSDNLETPAIDLPVSVEELRQHLRVDFTEDNAVIESYCRAAADYISTVLNRPLCAETRTAMFNPLDSHLWLGRPMVDTVTSVSWVGEGGDIHEMDPLDVKVHDRLNPWGAGYVTLDLDKLAPAPDRVNNILFVTYECGYEEPGQIPEALRQAVRLLAGSYYANREATVPGVSITELPLSVRHLIAPHKWRGLA